jgi:hypothetical protein
VGPTRRRGGGGVTVCAPRAGDAGGCGWAACAGPKEGARGGELGHGAASPRYEGEGERGKQAARGGGREKGRGSWAAGWAAREEGAAGPCQETGQERKGGFSIYFSLFSIDHFL